MSLFQEKHWMGKDEPQVEVITGNIKNILNSSSEHISR